MKLEKNLTEIKSLSNDEKKLLFDSMGVKNYSDIEASYLPDECEFTGFSSGGVIVNKTDNLPSAQINLINATKEKKVVSLAEFEKMNMEHNLQGFSVDTDLHTDYRHLRLMAKNVLDSDKNIYSCSLASLLRQGKEKTNESAELTIGDLATDSSERYRIIGSQINPFLSRNPIILTDKILNKKFKVTPVQFFTIPFNIKDANIALKKKGITTGYKLTELF